MAIDNKRSLKLNRETVRVLTSLEMAGIAGGEFPKTLDCPPPTTTLTAFACQMTKAWCDLITKSCPKK